MEIEGFQQTGEEKITYEQCDIDRINNAIRQMIDRMCRAEHRAMVKRGIARARAKRDQRNKQEGEI